MTDSDYYRQAAENFDRQHGEAMDAWRQFRLDILKALDVTDPWAITTWKNTDYVAAIERLRGGCGGASRSETAAKGVTPCSAAKA
jgi:hypothetical protein